MKPRVILEEEGELKVFPQEGGYAAPDIMIGDESVSSAIWYKFATSNKFSDVVIDPLTPKGKYRLTLTIIE